MSRLRRALAAIPVSVASHYAEAVVLDPKGKPDFGALQNAFDRRSTADIVLFVFHLPWINGKDIHGQPLHAGRASLIDLMESMKSPLLRYPDDFAEDHASLLVGLQDEAGRYHRQARGHAILLGRSDDWIKLECNLRQKFVVGGGTRVTSLAGRRSLEQGREAMRG